MKTICHTKYFKKLIESNSYYVDKTKIIEELLMRDGYVTLFLRPRRFGKSLFISMLDNFLILSIKILIKIYLIIFILVKVNITHIYLLDLL